MGMGRKQGEAVTLGFIGSSGNAVANAVVIYDANNKVRALLPTERLIVDMLQFDTEATDATNLVYVVAAAAAPSATPTANVLASFTAAAGIPNQGTVFPGEGAAQPLGLGLFLVLIGNAWASASTNLNGSGRIVNGSSRGVRAGFKELLTPGGNVTGQ